MTRKPRTEGTLVGAVQVLAEAGYTRAQIMNLVVEALLEKEER